MARKAEPVSVSAKIAFSTGQRSDSKDHRNRDNDNNSCHKTIFASTMSSLPYMPNSGD